MAGVSKMALYKRNNSNGLQNVLAEEKIKATNLVQNEGTISKEDRSRLLGYQNKVLWFTGIPGSGKSTLARAVEKKLHEKEILCYTLDGDNVRLGLNNDLGFSEDDRRENLRRIKEVAKLFHDAGIFVMVSFISPLKESRNEARKIIGNDFVEIFVNCPVEECEKRDVKGHYKKARAGLIRDFTGVSAPYEVPENPEITVHTHQESVEDSVKKIMEYLNLKI